MKDYYDPDHIPEYVDPRGPIYFNVTNEINGAMENYCGRWEGIPAGYTKAVALEEPNAQKTTLVLEHSLSEKIRILILRRNNLSRPSANINVCQ